MRVRKAASAIEHRPFSMAPEPAALLYELPFWLIALVCALLPASLAPWLNWAGVPVRSPEAAIVGAALIYGLLAVPGGRRFAAAVGNSPVMPVLVAIGYAAMTLLTSSLGTDDRTAMFLTLVFAAASPILAVALLHNKCPEDLRFFLWRLTAFTAGVSLIYVAKSLLSLGLRSELGQNIPVDFGIERVRGPLYGAATGYMALFPATGFAMHEAIEGRSRRWVAVAMVTILITALLGLGSRAAILMLAAYLLLLAFLTRGRAKRFISILLLLLIAAIGGALIFAQATTDRLQRLEDPLRRITHETAWRIVSELPLRTRL